MRPHRLDQARCTLCGLCAEVCGREIFRPVDGEMHYDPADRCIDCGHCVAVCPEAALVREDGSVPDPIEPARLPSAGALLRLFESRRSVRQFRREVPPRELLESLVEAARLAPTGSNKQDVHLVMVTDPERLETLRSRIMARYAQYEGYLARRLPRFLLSTFVDRRLGTSAIRTELRRFMDAFRAGRDPLFHRAPVAAFLYPGREATTGKDDCCLALYHMVLMAERLGLGSCLLGTVQLAFARTAALHDLLGVPRGRTILAAACFGHPRVGFERRVDRRPAHVRWL